MRTRSTGLGKMELVSKLESMKRQGDYLILATRSIEPVRWHVRVALSRQDLRGMLKMMLQGRNLLYVLSCLFKGEEGKHPGDF